MVASAASREAENTVRRYWFLLCCLSSFSAEADLLLTGQVDLLNPQEFVAPWSRNFQINIEWMADEGSVVEAGDLVVIFDPGELTGTIQQNETTLNDNAQGTQETLLRIEQELIDAEHLVTQAGYRLQIAELKANVPTSDVSALEYETAVFELIKARSDLEQAKVKLRSKQFELASERNRIALEVERLEAALAHDRQSLASMFLRAERSGPVIYATHPWHGGKFAAGQAVQMGTKVASIPVNDEMVIRSWVSEVDWPKVNVGQVVQLVADAYLDQPFKGLITKIGYQSEKKQNWGRSSYYPITIEFDKPMEFELKPGMSILVQLGVTSTNDPTSMIPGGPQTRHAGE